MNSLEKLLAGLARSVQPTWASVLSHLEDSRPSHHFEENDPEISDISEGPKSFATYLYDSLASLSRAGADLTDETVDDALTSANRVLHRDMLAALDDYATEHSLMEKNGGDGRDARPLRWGQYDSYGDELTVDLNRLADLAVDPALVTALSLDCYGRPATELEAAALVQLEVSGEFEDAYDRVTELSELLTALKLPDTATVADVLAALDLMPSDEDTDALKLASHGAFLVSVLADYSYNPATPWLHTDVDDWSTALTRATLEACDALSDALAADIEARGLVDADGDSAQTEEAHKLAEESAIDLACLAEPFMGADEIRSMNDSVYSRGGRLAPDASAARRGALSDQSLEA